jgi:hypothetical protein
MLPEQGGNSTCVGGDNGLTRGDGIDIDARLAVGPELVVEPSMPNRIRAKHTGPLLELVMRPQDLGAGEKAVWGFLAGFIAVDLRRDHNVAEAHVLHATSDADKGGDVGIEVSERAGGDRRGRCVARTDLREGDRPAIKPPRVKPVSDTLWRLRSAR